MAAESKLNYTIRPLREDDTFRLRFMHAQSWRDTYENNAWGITKKWLEAEPWLGDGDIELEVVSYNERAKAFYRKQGFVELPGENELFKGKLPNISMIRKGGKR